MLSRHSSETYPWDELSAQQWTLANSGLNSLSHCGLTLGLNEWHWRQPADLCFNKNKGQETQASWSPLSQKQRAGIASQLIATFTKTKGRKRQPADLRCNKNKGQETISQTIPHIWLQCVHRWYDLSFRPLTLVGCNQLWNVTNTVLYTLFLIQIPVTSSGNNTSCRRHKAVHMPLVQHALTILSFW